MSYDLAWLARRVNIWLSLSLFGFSGLGAKDRLRSACCCSSRPRPVWICTMACLWSPMNESKQARSTVAVSRVRFALGFWFVTPARALHAFEYCFRATSQWRKALSMGSRRMSSEGDPGGDSAVFSSVLYRAPRATTACRMAFAEWHSCSTVRDQNTLSKEPESSLAVWLRDSCMYCPSC